MGYYGTTFVVCCSRLCFGSIPGLEFSLSIPCVVILIFHGMLKLMLPSYVWLNQRCQRPCPNAALQAWLPVLPKKHPCNWQKKFYFIFLVVVFFFFSFTFCAIFLNCLDLLSNPIFQWIFHWVCLWSRTWPQGWLKWLQVVVTCFVYYYYYYCYNFQKWKSHGVPPSFMGL